jgi:hypothetical protein
MTPTRASAPVRRIPRVDARAREAVALDSQSSENAGQPSADGCGAALDGTTTEKAQVRGASGTPARGYSWPQFEGGNKVSLVHGASSPRAIAEKAEEVHRALVEHVPYLAQAIFAPQVSRYLEATAREQLLHGYIVRLCAEKGPQAVPSRVWEQATAASRLASQFADALGLSPRGHAELKALAIGAERAEQSVADLIAEGGRIRRAAEARLAAVPTDVPTERGTRK